MTTDRTTLQQLASRLRDLHAVGDPLVLVNAWDVASAREIEAAGAQALATSSAAFAASMGRPDDNSMPAELFFDFVRRVATGAEVPVTVDAEGGYDLPAAEFVGRLLEAGAVGCNLEDSDHRSGGLLDPERQADRLAAIRDAARDASVDMVVNARIDTLMWRPDDSPTVQVEDIVRRGRLYLDAGADCVYPIRTTDAAVTRDIVAALAAPVNVNAHPAVPLSALADAGAARISVGPMPFRALMTDLRRRAERLLKGDAAAFTVGDRS